MNRKLCLNLFALVLACAVPILSRAQPVYTMSAYDVEPDFVTLNGEVYGNFTWPTCWYDWGLTTNYGNTIAAFFPITQYPQNPLVFQAYLSLTNALPSTIYHFRAEASGFGYGVDATFITAGTPIITNQPQSQAITPGSTVTFTVGAYGRGVNPNSPTPYLNYQWQFNGAPIASANASTFTLTNVQGSNAGPYTVLVSNNDGSTNSDSASLTLLPLPFLTVTTTNGNLLLSWPVTPTNYILRTSINLQPPAWSDAPVTTVTNGNRITATLPVSDLNGQQFFEVQYP